VSTANAELNANAAYDAEMQSVIAYNNAILAHPRPSPASLAGRNCKEAQPGHSEGDCDDMYEADLETCRKLKSRACYAQAAERYAACKAGKPIPPLPFRLPN